MKNFAVLSLSRLLSSLLVSFFIQSVSAIDIAEVKIVPSLQCPSGYHHVSQAEADSVINKICPILDPESITKLEGEFKLIRSVDGCRIKPIDDTLYYIGKSLCEPFSPPVVFKGSKNYQAERSNVYFYTPYPAPLARKTEDVVYSDASTNSLSVWSIVPGYSKVTVAAPDESGLTHFINLRASLFKNGAYYRLNEGYGYNPLYAPSSFRFAFHEEDNQRLPTGSYRVGDIPVMAARWHQPNARQIIDSPVQVIGNLHSNAAKTPQRFNYDESLLPESAEAVFVLRILHANTGERFVINMSGNYLLEFRQDGIYIFDTYTKNSDVYKYQTENPNITLALGVSKGLADNYKNITIKEDANGLLYDYATLHSGNLSANEAMLKGTIRQPFYEIAGKDGIEGRVAINNATAFYHELYAHERHTRCVKSDNVVVDTLQAILSTIYGGGPCASKLPEHFYSASQDSANKLKLPQQLTDAQDPQKFYDTVGYQLQESLELKNQNTIAFLASSRYCRVPVLSRVEHHRHKRAPDGNCLDWTTQIVTLYVALQLNFLNINEIIHSVTTGNGIPAAFFPNRQYPQHSEDDRETLQQIILSHSDEAANVLQEAHGVTGEAAMADPSLLQSNEGARITSPVEVQHSVARARLGAYRLAREDFTPMPNAVRRVNHNLETEALDGQEYTTRIIHVTDDNIGSEEVENAIKEYERVLHEWREQIQEMKINSNERERPQLRLALGVSGSMLMALSNHRLNIEVNEIISSVYHNGALVGIHLGDILEEPSYEMDSPTEFVYLSSYSLVSPTSLLARENAYRGAVAYLRSEVLKRLFSQRVVKKAEAEAASRFSATTFLRLGFKHDEL